MKLRGRISILLLVAAGGPVVHELRCYLAFGGDSDAAAHGHLYLGSPALALTLLCGLALGSSSSRSPRRGRNLAGAPCPGDSASGRPRSSHWSRSSWSKSWPRACSPRLTACRRSPPSVTVAGLPCRSVPGWPWYHDLDTSRARVVARFAGQPAARRRRMPSSPGRGFRTLVASGVRSRSRAPSELPLSRFRS